MSHQVSAVWQPGKAGLAGDILSRGALEAVVLLPEWQLREMSFLGDVSLDIGGVGFRLHRHSSPGLHHVLEIRS